nr:reverse transcriptase domain-containing protein [Tanacetum cinerariifolium]
MSSLRRGALQRKTTKKFVQREGRYNHADYPIDGRDKEDKSFGDDADDEDEEEASEDDDEEEEEEHLALANSSVVPTVDPVPFAKDTEAFKTDDFTPTPPSPRLHKARIFVRPETSIPTYAEAPLGYKAVMIQWRAASPSTHHPLEIPSLPLLLPSTTHRDDLPEANMLLQKRACFTAPTGRFEVRESSSAAAARQARHTLAHRVDYGFVDTVDASIYAAKSRAMITVEKVNERVTNLATSQRQDAQELYVHCEDAQDDQALLRDQKIPLKRTTTTTTPTPMTDSAIKALIAQGVAEALVKIKANRTSRNGDDNHDSGTGSRRTERAAHDALTWWNSHVKTIGHDVAYEIPCKTLKKVMTAKYYPRGKIKKLEIKLWNLKVKRTDMLSYNQCFQELALMCSRMFPKESNEVKKYVGGLPDMIQGSVMASKPKIMQDVIEFASELMDQKIRSALLSVPTVRGMAIYPRTVEASLLLPTTKESQGQITRVSLSLSVELKAITRGIAQS